MQSRNLASELIQKLPPAALASLVASLGVADIASAADIMPPTQQAEQVQKVEFAQSAPLAASTEAPDVKADSSGIPEGTAWRYSEFVNAVENGKVRHVIFYPSLL